MSLLDIGVSGLRVAQHGLSTTGHNITNVNTEGYNRQRTEQESTIGLPFAGTLLGNGARLKSITRAYNEFNYREVLYNESQYNYHETMRSNAARIDDLLADSDTGITKNIEEMFDAVNGITEEPTIISARNVGISTAESLAKRFNNLQTEMEQQHLGNINEEIETTVETINEITTRIAELNNEITVANSIGGEGFPPNDLLDKRDLLIKELSEKISVNIIDLPDGSMNMTIGTGITLIAGNISVPLSVVRNEFDASKLEIGVSATPGAKTKSIITQELKGGSLTGLFDIRDEVLLPAIREVGKIAIAYADAFNRQQSMGRDFNGDIGQNMFKDVNDPQVVLDRVFNSNQNSVQTNVEVYIRDASSLTGENYTMKYDAGNITIKDSEGNTVSGTPVAFPGAGTRLSIPEIGIDIEFQTNLASPANDGDEFLIRPTYNGARDIESVITDPKKIAAADNYLETNATLNPDNLSLDLYEISNELNPAFPGPVNGPPSALPDQSIRINIDAGANTYDITDPLGASLIGGPIAIPADKILEGPGLRFRIDGDITANASFTVRRADNDANDDANTKPFGPGDNTNALAMLNLQNTKTLDGQSNTFSESYAELVTFVGVETQTRKISTDSFETLLESATERNAAISGVNLDEEAANLIKFQQAYSASSRIISTGRDIFETLLQAVR
ncbi:flagellar hook-associated protein FlgK [Flocculibacter collagenilyticus]|uniref:flagellar hook-associated protein FlgK n=1 Tax=Flocculibacter collagenilyticus TaxID=2744479 RepID=UPI0018F75F4B|nr:flagellar hook-associated protein FlgK [Flocculibacter collagenilyticus]